MILPYCDNLIILLLCPGCSWKSQACLLRPCWRLVQLHWPSNSLRSLLRGCRFASCACRPSSPARRSDGSATAPCRTRTLSECDHPLKAQPVTIRQRHTDWLTLNSGEKKEKEKKGLYFDGIIFDLVCISGIYFTLKLLTFAVSCICIFVFSWDIYKIWKQKNLLLSFTPPSWLKWKKCTAIVLLKMAAHSYMVYVIHKFKQSCIKLFNVKTVHTEK